MNPLPQPSLWDAPAGPDAGTIAGRFERFHAAHPEVFDEIVRLARQLRGRGFERYSMKGLFEIVRHNHHIGKGPGEDFALNNDYSPLYARLVMATCSDLAGFFETRGRRAD